MKDLNEIQCFVKAIELKSLTAAAKSLGLPKSSVSRKIQNLERRLNLTLVVRTTRALNLTHSGKAFYERALLALKELDQAEEHVDSSRDSIEGLLRITCPIEFATGPFNKMLSNFLLAYPNVKIDLVLTERTVDLITEGFDLAFRAGDLSDSSLIVKKLPAFDAKIYASPSYLKRNGTPKSINDLEKFDLIGFAPGGKMLKWQLKGPTGKKEITIKSKLNLNHMLAAKESAINGMGLILMPEFMAAEEISKDRLKAVCPDWISPNLRINIIYPAQKFVSPKMRAFIDYTVKNLNL